MAGFAFIGAAFLQLFDVGVVMPIMNRLTGTTIDYGDSADLRGNLWQLLLLLVLTWTLAASGKEIVHRGYLQVRLTDLLGSQLPRVLLTVGISSLLFGLAHTEQGLVGVVVATIDALFFSSLKLRYNNLWAAVLAHGFCSSVGITVFYVAGPITGLWEWRGRGYEAGNNLSLGGVSRVPLLTQQGVRGGRQFLIDAAGRRNRVRRSVGSHVREHTTGRPGSFLTPASPWEY
jgi:hypothetical protein